MIDSTQAFAELGAAAVLLGVFGTLTWVTVFRAIPYLGQRIAVYRLHDLRDELDVCVAQFPEARFSLIYRELDDFIAFAIHVVRDKNLPTAMGILARMAHRTSTPSPEREQIDERIRNELRTSFSRSKAGLQTYEQLRHVVDRVASTVLLRVVLGHPGLLLLSLIAGLISIIKIIFGSSSSKALGDQLARLTESVRASELTPTRFAWHWARRLTPTRFAWARGGG